MEWKKKALTILTILAIVVVKAISGPIAALECEAGVHTYCVGYCLYLMIVSGPAGGGTCVAVCAGAHQAPCIIALLSPTP